jgi:exopolysaccharide biosynthesis protein
MESNYGRNVKVRGGSGGGYGNPPSRNGRSGGRGYSRKNQMPIWLVIVIDVLIAALLLGIFYVTNYMIKAEVEPIEMLPTPSAVAQATATPEPTGGVSESPGAAVSQTVAPTVDPNDWRAKFADKFTSGEVEQTDTSYRNANISVTINKAQKENLTYFVADIYVADIKYFKTAFAEKADVLGHTAQTTEIAQQNNAIVAINGDYCLNNNGIVVRNGKLYPRDASSADSLVMGNDGVMTTYSPDEISVDKIKTEGAYQVWSFGPMLLDNGQAMTKFNSTVNKTNPRTAVGYYEPGHYCFVVVDGRQGSYSEGMTLQELSQLFADLGCKAAYNLDGGQTSEMAFMGEFANQPYDGGRSCSDIIYIAAE